MARTYVLKTVGGGELKGRIGDLIGGGFWRWNVGEEKVFTVTKAVYKGPLIKNNRGINVPPDVMDVVDVKTGHSQKVLVHKVLLSKLSENYPGDTYVGRTFSVTQVPSPEGKRYNDFQVAEVEFDGDDGAGTQPVDDAGAATESKPAKSSKKK